MQNVQAPYSPKEKYNSLKEDFDKVVQIRCIQSPKICFISMYTERKKKRRVEFFPSYFNHFLRCLL